MSVPCVYTDNDVRLIDSINYDNLYYFLVASKQTLQVVSVFYQQPLFQCFQLSSLNSSSVLVVNIA